MSENRRAQPLELIGFCKCAWLKLECIKGCTSSFKGDFAISTAAIVLKSGVLKVSEGCGLYAI